MAHRNPLNYIGPRIKKIRLEAGLDHRGFGEAIGMSSMISFRLEQGNAYPSGKALIQIYRVFGYTPNYILGLED